MNLQSVIENISSIFDIDKKNVSAELIYEKINTATPHQIAQLIALENESMKIISLDIASARNMNSTNKEKFLPFLASAIILFYFISIVFLSVFSIPIKNVSIVDGGVRTIENIVMMIVAFYFGSSFGSMRKTDLISLNTDIKKSVL